MSDQIILFAGKLYIILVMAIGISLGIMKLHFYGWLVWFFGLVLPLLILLALNRLVSDD